MTKYHKTDIIQILPTPSYTIFIQSLGSFSTRLEKLLRIEKNDFLNYQVDTIADR